jgi:hypothetical protein
MLVRLVGIVALTKVIWTPDGNAVSELVPLYWNCNRTDN